MQIYFIVDLFKFYILHLKPCFLKPINAEYSNGLFKNITRKNKRIVKNMYFALENNSKNEHKTVHYSVHRF